MSGIQGKVILITGASSGIGESTARVPAGKGARVVLGARRTDRLEKLVREIRDTGREAEFRALAVRASKTFKRSPASRWKRTDTSMLLSTILPYERVSTVCGWSCFRFLRQP